MLLKLKVENIKPPNRFLLAGALMFQTHCDQTFIPYPSLDSHTHQMPCLCFWWKFFSSVPLMRSQYYNLLWDLHEIWAIKLYAIIICHIRAEDITRIEWFSLSCLPLFLCHKRHIHYKGCSLSLSPWIETIWEDLS